MERPDILELYPQSEEVSLVVRSRVLETLRAVSRMEWMLLAASSLATALSLYLYLTGRPARGVLVDDVNTGAFLLVASWVLAVLMVLITRPSVYHVAMVARIATAMFLMVFTATDAQIPVLIVSVLVCELCTYDAFPRNVFIGAGAVVMSAGVRFLSLTRAYQVGSEDALILLSAHVFVGILAAVVTSFLVRWREELVGSQHEERRLDAMVGRLTKANLQSQDFAGEVQETAMENERKRITRDIHDVVGYTLTNNIMMMEAAIDMVKRNPQGVQALMGVARENAQEGLERIRESMYALRRRDVTHPTGLLAVARLLRVYERATAVNVDSHFGNVRWEHGEEIDSAIYHIVQESLMNSFRHGKARNVRLVLEQHDGGINILVRDDGIGAEAITEGIGLNGIRERVSRLRGTVRASGAEHGFVVQVRIPLEEE